MPKTAGLFLRMAPAAFQTSHLAMATGPVLRSPPGFTQTPTSTMMTIDQRHSHQERSLWTTSPIPSFTAFPLIENLSPSPWDGFGFGSDTNTYMGAYDADMSWTLDYLPSENSPNYLLDHDMLNSFDDLRHYQFSQPKFEQPSTQDTDDADGEDEDTADWPDKIDRPNTLHASQIVLFQSRCSQYHGFRFSMKHN